MIAIIAPTKTTFPGRKRENQSQLTIAPRVFLFDSIKGFAKPGAVVQLVEGLPSVRDSWV